MQELFIVIRTDVSKDSGQQRVFGAFDDKPAAETLRKDVSENMRGEFAVWIAKPIEE